jgi:8-oxo-dGTP pyrophosphatase MutT (NUDIX family)
MSVTHSSPRHLPTFDALAVPVHQVDKHLPSVPRQQLTPQALRQRFLSPPLWTAEYSTERKYMSRPPAAAAVLVPLVMREELCLLLTERGAQLSTHSGQIAFPGGRTDESDRDAVHTALREAEEEIGLPPSHVEVLGTLPTYTTGSAYIITPVVALVQPGFELRPNPAEVADVFEVPLGYLMNPAHHRRHLVEHEGASWEWLSMPWTSPEARLPKERFIWGATAGMLRNLYGFLVA